MDINGDIKNLEKRLSTAREGEEEIDALNALAHMLKFNDPARATELSERALKLSHYGQASEQVYAKGAALAMRTLGLIDAGLLNLNSAMFRLFEARHLLESLDEPDALLDTMDYLGWGYFNLGDFPRAIEVYLNGLKIAREKKLFDQEVSMLCHMGSVYSEIGDHESSLEVLRRALDYMKDSGTNRLHSIALNNLAMEYFTMRKYDKALECGTRALEMARQLESAELEEPYLDTVGQVEMARKEYERAEKYIKESIALCKNFGRNEDENNLSLARLYVEQNRMEEASNLISSSLASVEERGTHRLGFLFHELFCRLYEICGDYPRALKQYKLFHKSMALVFNEDTQRTLGNLKIVHHIETSRLDSEIYRLKNLALNSEISMRRRAVAHMEVLATTDALTGLFNRRHFLTLGGYSMEESRKTGHPLTVLWMDIDNFKLVNDRHGHPAGDQVLKELSGVIQTSLRTGDLLSRYGGEEFTALLHNTGLAGALQVAERICKNVAGHIIHMEDIQIQVTLSIGAARALTSEEDLETLLARADAAQYTAKREGKNRVVVDWTGDPVKGN